MIRFAIKEDYKSIYELWCHAFGEDDFAKWYFEEIYSPQTTLVYELDEQIVSMLARLPYKIASFGDVTYIYGACTHEDYRRRGLMRELFSFSEEIDIKEGKTAIILIPENPNLFEFYDKLGYDKRFYKYLRVISESRDCLEADKNLFISNNNSFINNNNKTSTENKRFQDMFYLNVTIVKPENSKIIYKLSSFYNQIHKDEQIVIRDEDYFKKLISMHQIINGSTYIFLDGSNKVRGYALGYSEESFIITELAYDEQDIRHEIIKQLSYRHNSLKILNELQGTYKISYGSMKILQKNKNINKLIINEMFD